MKKEGEQDWKSARKGKRKKEKLTASDGFIDPSRSKTRYRKWGPNLTRWSWWGEKPRVYK